MKIWGYETTWGSFAQFARAKEHQCLPKPERLTWEAAAAYMLVASTAYRMLTGWPPHTVRPGDVVLVRFLRDEVEQKVRLTLEAKAVE